MTSFQNTIDTLGDEVTAMKIIDKTITEYKDDTVAEIGRESFYYCDKLTNVDLPNITKIGNSAFQDCKALISVKLPAAPPTEVGYNAFYSINSACVFYVPTGSLAAYQAATNWSTLMSTYSFVEEDR